MLSCLIQTMSEFRVSILRPDGQRVWLLPGSLAAKGEAGEIDFIAACVAAIVGKGVGLGRTESHVRLAIEQGLTEVVMGMKASVLPKPR